MSPARFKYERWLERKVLNGAAAIIHTGHGRAELEKKTFTDIPSDKHHVITNGYDETDFEMLDTAGVSGENKKDGLNIVNIGHLYGDSAFGYFIEGFERVIRSHNVSSNLRVSFISASLGQWQDILFKPSLKSHIDMLGLKTHKETIKEIMKADVLLLLPPSGGGLHREIFVAGKTFELMRTGRPIFMIGWKGESSQMIEKSGLGKFVYCEDIDQIEKSILEYYNKKKNGQLTTKPNWEYIRQFERKYLTGKLAELLNMTYTSRG